MPVYASLIAWLPPLLHPARRQRPVQRFAAGAADQVGQTAGALLLPALARQEDRRQLLLLALALQLIGFCGFIWLPEHFSALWAIACGVGLGGAFPLCLVLALDHAGQPAVAGRLVAFMQGDRIYHRRSVAPAFRPAA